MMRKSQDAQSSESRGNSRVRENSTGDRTQEEFASNESTELSKENSASRAENNIRDGEEKFGRGAHVILTPDLISIPKTSLNLHTAQMCGGPTRSR